MMKKLFCLVLLFITSIVPSCNTNKKINTVYGSNKIDNALISINKAEFIDLMEEEATFIFIQTTDSCTCSDVFMELIKRYINEHKNRMYYIEYNQVKDLTYPFAFRENAPTFHIVKNGKSAIEKVPGYNDPFFTDYNYLRDNLDKMIVMPSIFYVDEEELDALYNQNNKFAILFALSKCKECEYLQNVLIPRFANNNFNMKKMYLFDLYKYKQEGRFDEIRAKYGLNNAFKWGYQNKGQLPSFHLIEPKDNKTNNVTLQAYMFGNDVLKYENNKFVIKESFYDSNRVNDIKYSNVECMINKTFNENDVIKVKEDYYFLKISVNENLYSQYCFDFLNYLNNNL